MATHTSLAARHLGATQSPSPMASTKPRLRGALRGLDLDNRLSQAVTETSIEDQDPTASIDNTPRHETRSTRNGRANVNYSQKYHPMDEVTRPKRAQRITGSRSLSASASHDGLDTSDEDEPELYSASESSDAIDQDDEAESPVERTPDPRAVRHSARAEAKKPVNYSKNHHPQDSAIPGFQHRAKRKRRSAQIDRPRKKKTKVQATADEPIVLSSERVIDSDSEGEVEGDRPPTIHSTPAKVSTAEERQSSPASQDPDIGESDTPSSDDKRPPDMPRGESSFNEAENIIQGKHIAWSQIFGKANDGLSDTGSAVAEDSERNLDDMNNKIIEATTIKTFLDNVGTSDGSQSDPASDECDQPDEHDVRPTRTTMPVALVTPVSMEASATPSQSYIQPKETSMIGTPRLGSQPMSSSSREAQKSSQLEFADEHLSPSIQPKLPTQHSSAGAEEGSTCEEKHQREVFCQALRGCSEQAARVARAKQFTDGLSSEPSLLDRDTSEPRCEESNSDSRQISRDTLPDDPSSNHFEEAIAVTGGGPQHDNDDDLPGQSNSEYSQMAVSDRERSDACAPDKSERRHIRRWQLRTQSFKKQ